MRHICAVLTSLGAVAIPAQAMATVYNFHSTETSALSATPTTFDFSLNTATAVVGAGAATNFGNVTIRTNGVATTGNMVSEQFNTNLASPLFFFISTGPTAFSSGVGPAIVFNTGNLAIADGATDGIGVLTITAAAGPVSPVPEPATLSLLAAGVAMVGAMGNRLTRRKPMTSIA